jgi:hypothetical protein
VEWWHQIANRARQDALGAPSVDEYRVTYRYDAEDRLVSQGVAVLATAKVADDTGHVRTYQAGEGLATLFRKRPATPLMGWVVGVVRRFFSVRGGSSPRRRAGRA